MAVAKAGPKESKDSQGKGGAGRLGQRDALGANNRAVGTGWR